MTVPVVAIVGRPNVGKSTLFNRLVGFSKSAVYDRPGVTRDRLYESAELLEREVLLVDTGGIEAQPETDLLAAMREQSMIAIREADVIVFMVDGRAGLVAADIDVAEIMRRANKPVFLAVNKVDGDKHEALAAEFWEIGIQPMFTVSAEHGRGLYELLEAVVGALPPAPEEKAEEDDQSAYLPEGAEDEGIADFSGPVRIAVIGRPNIGKSTLINALLGEERHLVHDSPGTTMDPVDSPVTIAGRDYVFVDTAGVRKKARIEDKLERFVTVQSIRTIERCHVTLLMIDATAGINDQDARLAQLVIERGRGLIVLINKWDLVKEHEDIDSHSVEDRMAQKLPHVAPWAPHLFISARTGKGTHRILPLVDAVFDEFNRRVSTSRLNKWLAKALEANSPPQSHHHPVRLYYGSQTRVRPPTFAFWTNNPEGVAPSYMKYLQNGLRDSFGFQGSPIKLTFKLRRKPDGRGSAAEAEAETAVEGVEGE